MKDVETFLFKQYFNVNKKACFCGCPGRKSPINFCFRKTSSDKVVSHRKRKFSGNFQKYLFIIAISSAMYFESRSAVLGIFSNQRVIAGGPLIASENAQALNRWEL